MNHNDRINKCLEIAFQTRRKYLLSGKEDDSRDIARAIRVDLVNFLEQDKSIGWLSISGRDDKFMGRGGAWVCVNFLNVYSEIKDSEELDSVSITIFSHRHGAGFANIIALGLLKFGSGEKYIARSQANGEYKVTRDDTLIKTLEPHEVEGGLSDNRASEFVEKFGML